jgi:hypothetical protein
VLIRRVPGLPGKYCFVTSGLVVIAPNLADCGSDTAQVMSATMDSGETTGVLSGRHTQFRLVDTMPVCRVYPRNAVT